MRVDDDLHRSRLTVFFRLLLVLPHLIWLSFWSWIFFGVVVFNWFFKVMVEVVMTPATYAIVGWLKRHEHVDHYDTDTNFTPFSLKD